MGTLIGSLIEPNDTCLQLLQTVAKRMVRNAIQCCSDWYVMRTYKLQKTKTMYINAIWLAQGYCFSVKELLRSNNSEVQNNNYVQKVDIFKNRTQFSEKSIFSKIVHTSRKSWKFPKSYTLLGRTSNSRNDRFGLNVIVTASELSRAK